MVFVYRQQRLYGATQSRVEKEVTLNVWMHRLALGLIVMCYSFSTYARDIDRGKSIGYAQAIGGPQGLAIGLGLGDLHVEGIVGGTYFSGNSATQATFIGVAMGGHYHLLRARSAALAVGARVNLGTGSSVSVTESSLGLESQVRSKDIIQWGVDLPFRIYWFPTPSISLHTEFGIAVLLSPEEGQVFENESRNGFSLQPGEILIRFFEGENAFGRFGLTFWW